MNKARNNLKYPRVIYGCDVLVYFSLLYFLSEQFLKLPYTHLIQKSNKDKRNITDRFMKIIRKSFNFDNLLIKINKITLRYWLSSAAAAKSLQSCPTLCDPIDSSPPGSAVPGILQARTLEWVAISFSNACK